MKSVVDKILEGADITSTLLEEYIPDITDRYPEGMSGVSGRDDDLDLDDIEKLPTVADVIKSIEEDGDYFNCITVRTLGDNKLIGKFYKLDDLKKFATDRVGNWFWHDADIGLYLAWYNKNNVPVKEDLDRGDKYILFTQDGETEFDDFESAKQAYKEHSGNDKFLYQPDKTYFLGTVVSTSYVTGHDHRRHKNTAKITGLFIAKNKNQINKFLEKSGWKTPRGDDGTVARLYGNGPYGSLCQSNTDWERFKLNLNSYFYKIDRYASALDADFGAIDVSKDSCRCPYVWL